MIDTDVAVHLRDLNGHVLDRIDSLSELPLMSVITCVELEGGVYSDPGLAKLRRPRVDALYARIKALPFGTDAAVAYGAIVSALGYSRRQVADRMIAATAIVNGLTLITMNGWDFTAIPRLNLEVWQGPAG